MTPTDPTYGEWQGMSGGQRMDLINRDPGLAFRMQANEGQSSTDSASPFRFQDPNNPNPTPGTSADTYGLNEGYTHSNGGYLGSPEHKAAMGNAYNSSNYNYSSIPGYSGWYSPEKEEDAIRRFLAGLGGSQNNSGYDAAAAMRSMIAGINQKYDTSRGAIDQQNTQAKANLQNILGSFTTNVGNNQASYMQGSDSIQKAMAERAAQAQAQAATQSQGIQASLAGQGGNASAVNAQAAANQTVADQSGQAQQDLSKRFDQVSQFNQKNVLNSGALVQQGAAGQQQNQYTDLINALELARQQEISAAQSGGGSGGGGGGGGGTASDRKASREQDIIDSAYEGGSSSALMGALFLANKSMAESIDAKDYDPSIWERNFPNEGAYKDALVREAIAPYVSQGSYRAGNFEDKMDARYNRGQYAQ